MQGLFRGFGFFDVVFEADHGFEDIQDLESEGLGLRCLVIEDLQFRTCAFGLRPRAIGS